MKRILNIICLILWSICFAISVVQAAQGETTSPVTVMLPSLTCVINYAEKVFKE